jgi:hypothetical protein
VQEGGLGGVGAVVGAVDWETPVWRDAQGVYVIVDLRGPVEVTVLVRDARW